MARTRVQETKEDIIRTTRKQMSHEKTDLIESPDRRANPKYDKDAQVDWKALEKSRYDAPVAIKEAMDKVLDRITEIENDEDETKKQSSEYFALLAEASKHAMNLSRSIDTAIPNFYDPKESKMDIKREIIIKYEATNGVD